MEVDFKELKKIVDDTILTEAKSMRIISSLLKRENKGLCNPILGKIIEVTDKWQDTPPVEILKELEEFEQLDVI